MPDDNPPPRDEYLIEQTIRIEPIWPYSLSLVCAMGRWYDDPIYGMTWEQRQRCHICDMYTRSCLPADARCGGQYARLFLDKNGVLRTGMFSRYGRDQHFEERDWGTLIGWGFCQSKEQGGKLSVGNLALVPSLLPGRHFERYRIADELSDGWGTDAEMHVDQDSSTRGVWIGAKDVSGVLTHRDGFLRLPIDVPADAIILSAKLVSQRILEDQEAPAWTRLWLLNRDNMAPFSEVIEHPDNPMRGNPYGPTRINCHQGSSGPMNQDNLYEIELANGGGEYGTLVTLTNLSPMIARFIERPGYAPGNYMGIAMESAQDLNFTDLNHVRGESYGEPRGAILYVEWREAGSDPNPPYPHPPRLRGYVRLTHKGIRCVDGEPEPTSLVYSAVAKKMADSTAAGSYRNMALIPVAPLSAWWDQETFGDPPYDADAHNRFPLDDCQTYRVKRGHNRYHPYHYESEPSLPPCVEEGLRGIVARASAPAKHGHFAIYGSPGCAGFEGETWPLVENIIHRYRGITLGKRHVYPYRPEWSVTYQAIIKAWFVLDEFWGGWADANNGPTEAYGYFPHWNCWYEGEVKAIIVGDVSDAGFAAFIRGHRAGFGATFEPATRRCNDVLRGCGGVEHAMGDVIYPSAGAQSVCAQPEAEPSELPCRNSGKSWWYLPWGAPGAAGFQSNHIMTPLAGPVIPQLPEYGLAHRIKMVRKLDPTGTQTDTDTTQWARIVFTTNLPELHAADDGPDPDDIVNEIQRITIVDTYGVGQPPASGWFAIGLFEDEHSHSDGIGPEGVGMTAAVVQTALEMCSNIPPGSVSVTGPEGGPWDVEFVGTLAGMNVEMLTVFINSLWTWTEEGTCDGHMPCYGVEVEQIQQGSGAGSGWPPPM